MQFLFDPSLQLDHEMLQQKASSLADYHNYLKLVAEKNNYDYPESSLNLPFDQDIKASVLSLAKKMVTPKLKYIIDIGIGGSNLGTKAVYDALFGTTDLVEPDRFPKMFFADTVNGNYLTKFTSFLRKKVEKSEEVLLCVISKSGGTTETIVNFEIMYQALIAKFPDVAKRVVAITDPGSKFEVSAQERGIAVLNLPKTVGGRYSVLSAVGLFPLHAAGVNINELLQGAAQMRDLCLENMLKNPALLSAKILFQGVQEGRMINDNFIFHPELESLGKWYRQLMGESIGKEKDLDGKTVNTGITPTVSIGSTDLHSVGQLYLGGPKDKITTFLYAKQQKETVTTPDELFFPSLVAHINNVSATHIMDAILQGVKIAYTKRALPFMEVVLPDISERSLGEFLQFKMLEMMYVGKLMQVNPFDQPNVEAYKGETKQILATSSLS